MGGRYHKHCLSNPILAKGKLTMPPIEKTVRYQIPILRRTLRIQELLASHPEGLSVPDMARRLDYPKNSVYRICMTLLATGYMQCDEQKRYSMTHKILALGNAVLQGRGIVDAALEDARTLRDDLRETVAIQALLEDNRGVVLEAVAGLHPFRFAVDPGSIFAPHASAAGKAILAYLPQSRVNTILSDYTFEKFTDATITDRAAFEQALAETREHGYGVDLAEALEGVSCISAPIRNASGEVVAALTVTAPPIRMGHPGDDSFNRFTQAVTSAARRTSQKLGFHR